MNPYVVALTPCATYEMESVEQAMIRLIDKLGGLQSLVKPGDRVLIFAPPD